MKALYITLIAAFPLQVFAQSYKDSIATYRQHYKQEFITEERSPLKAADTGYLRFYDADVRYRVNAQFTATPDAKVFDMPTHSGKTKQYRQYGLLSFTVDNIACSLQVYQSQTLMKNPKYADDLFIPFTDTTSYVETYGGGRYMDVHISDIKDGKLMLDFNKSYNPYCAYAGGYNCPVPPVENRLPIAIRAGEQLFGKEH